MKTRPQVFRTIAAATAVGAMVFTLLPNRALAQSDAQAPAAAPPSNPSASPAGGPNGEPWLPAGVREVLKMHKGGISPDVLTHYIDNSQGPFHLSADAVIYLQQQGIPTKVITELISRDSVLQQQSAQAYQSGAYGQAPPPGMVVAPQTPPPAINGYAGMVEPPPVYPAYPDYGYYGYPYYPYYWPGGVAVYGGWGWGWGGRYWGPGFRGGIGGFRGGVGGFHGGGGGFHGGGGGFHGGGGHGGHR